MKPHITPMQRPFKLAYIRTAGISLLLSTIVTPATVHATSATWIGGSGADWATATNWSPNTTGGPGVSGSAATNSDVATFANAGTISITDSTASRSLLQIAFDASGSLGNYTIGSSSNDLYFKTNGTAGNIVATGTTKTGSHQIIASNLHIMGNSGSTGSDLRINTAYGFNGTLELTGQISSSAASGKSGLRIITSGSFGGTNNANANNLVVLAGVVSDGTSGATVGVSHLRDGILRLTAANTYSAGYLQGDGADSYKSVTQIGVDSVGVAGAPISGAFGTGIMSLSGGRISSDGATARTIYNNYNLSGGIWLGDTTNNGALTFAGAGTLVSGTTFLTVDSAVTLSGTVGGSGSLQKMGYATLTLTGSNTYAGSTTVSAGTLQIGNGTTDGSISSGTIAITSGASIDYNIAGQQTLNGAISGAGSFFKNGVGTLVLAGSNSYTGTTTVSAGKLAVNGSIASSAVTVASGGTLGGSGTTGAVTVASGGHFAPGNSITTTFKTGALTLSAGSATDIELGTASTTAASSLNDLTTVAGALVLGGSLNLVDNAGANGQGSAGAGIYQIFTGAASVTGAFSDIANVSGYHAKVTNDASNVYVSNYQVAAASITTGTTVNLGITHVGEAFTNSTLGIKNTATSNGFAEKLNASANGTTGAATVAGSISSLVGGSTNTSAITVGLNDTTAGAKTGTVTLGFASTGAGTSGYGTTNLDSQTVTVNGQVNYYAAPVFVFTSGDGALAGSGTSYTLNLGTYNLVDGERSFSTTLTLSNSEFDAVYQDILEGTLTLGGARFSLIGASAVNLESGHGVELTVNFDTAGLTLSGTGIYTGLLTLDGTSVNASSSSGLSGVNVALELQVIPEPATWAIMMGGLGTLIGIQRLRRKNGSF